MRRSPPPSPARSAASNATSGAISTPNARQSLGDTCNLPLFFSFLSQGWSPPYFKLFVLVSDSSLHSIVVARTLLRTFFSLFAFVSDSKSRFIVLQIVVLDYLELTLHLDSFQSLIQLIVLLEISLEISLELSWPMETLFTIRFTLFSLIALVCVIVPN